MGFTFDVSGMAELSRQLDKLGEKGRKIASEALYEGAGVMADQVSQAVKGIATKRFKYPAPPGKQRMPSPEEKALIENAPRGVSRFKNTATSVETNVGLRNAGYGTINGKTKPIPMIANAINSGTSFMKKQPFFRKATRPAAAKAALENALQKRLNELSLD